jgi:UDP-N-acetylmuramate--alanine ligase
MKVFCIGIGGIGLSGVAQILKSQGHEVSGSDASPSLLTESLEKAGIKVFSSHLETNIDETFDLVIYSEAVPESNLERTRAKQLGLKSVNYARALGMLSEQKKTVAITGTHGKTTVTGMLTSILLEALKDPTIIIGSKIDLLDGQNFRIGEGELFLCEACEYRDNFLELTPHIVLINNLDPDHLDYFGTAEKYYESFQKLAEKIPESGMLILFEEDAQKMNLKGVKAPVTILKRSEKAYSLQVPGKHNQQNAFAAEAVAKALGINDSALESGLRAFRGTWRRFEYKGSINGAKIYDDYGHHPTEIKATIQAAREWFPEKNLVVVFQPHQYSRTHQFFEEFIHAFELADQVWVTDIYKARDTQEDIKKVSAEKLAAAIGNKARYAPFAILPQQLQSTANEQMTFLIMGAGNINGVFQHLVFDPQKN